MVHFPGTAYRSHTSCMTEDQKYQGALYKNKKAKTHNNSNNETALAAPIPEAMPQQAYVEDVVESFADYEYEDMSDHGRSPADLPEAPTPPPAAEAVLNVFDFLDPSATPNASTLQLGAPGQRLNHETSMVRFDHEAHAYLDDAGAMVDEDPDALIQYGTGPIPGAFETPAPGRERRRHKDGSDVKKDKKRKRLHVDTDQIMADADADMPPGLHTGLTGGMNRMMRSDFPPSPDYSGGDADLADPSPASPLKKKKHSKHSKSKKSEGIGSNLMGLLTSSKSKSKKRKVSSSSKKSSSSRRREREREHDAEKAPKLIEYRPHSSEGAGADNQVVLFRPRADLLLSYIDKGPDSDRGYSMKKALRHFHRDREDSGDCLSKSSEEKELWRSLRMRKNERGEIVLFSL